MDPLEDLCGAVGLHLLVLKQAGQFRAGHSQKGRRDGRGVLRHCRTLLILEQRNHSEGRA